MLMLFEDTGKVLKSTQYFDNSNWKTFRTERESSGNYFSIKSEVEVKKTNTPFFLPIIEKYNIRFFPRFYSLKLLQPKKG